VRKCIKLDIGDSNLIEYIKTIGLSYLISLVGYIFSFVWQAIYWPSNLVGYQFIVFCTPWPTLVCSLCYVNTTVFTFCVDLRQCTHMLAPGNNSCLNCIINHRLPFEKIVNNTKRGFIKKGLKWVNLQHSTS